MIKYDRPMIVFFLWIFVTASISEIYSQESTTSNRVSKGSGKISGIVRDSTTKDPLPFVIIKILPSGPTVSSDIDGNFSFNRIEPGIYSISVRYIGYKKFVQSGIEVFPYRTTMIHCMLEPQTYGEEEPPRKQLPQYMVDPELAKKGGHFWIPIEGLSEKSICSFAVDPKGFVYAASPEGPIYRSFDDDSEDWEEVSSGIDNVQSTTLAVNSRGDVFLGTRMYSGCLMAAPQRDGIFRSTDHGESWSDVEYTIWVYSIQTVKDEIYVCSNTFNLVSELFHSVNGGNSWINKGDGLPIQTTEMAIDSNGTIFVEAYKNGIFSRNRNDSSWSKIHNGFSDTSISNIMYHPSGRLFVTIYYNTPPEDYEYKYDILSSDDRGKTWKSTGAELLGVQINTMMINSKGHIFIGTNSGVFQSTDIGRTWIEFGREIIDLPINSIAIDNFGYLLAGTHRYGIFKSAQPIQ